MAAGTVETLQPRHHDVVSRLVTAWPLLVPLRRLSKIGSRRRAPIIVRALVEVLFIPCKVCLYIDAKEKVPRGFLERECSRSDVHVALTCFRKLLR